MQKITAYSVVLAFCLISSGALAEWVIPGTNCVAENGGNILYHYNGITNQSIRGNNANPTSVFVSCTSPVLNNYGSNLDLDFYIQNNSRDHHASCYGHSLDAHGRIIQITSKVQVNPGTGHNGVATIQERTLFNTTPVTIVAYCFIPDRGVNGRDNPSKLVGIRVY